MCQDNGCTCRNAGYDLRETGYLAAVQHWTTVGYRDNSARRLARAKWGYGAAQIIARLWTLNHTNLRQCDLV